MERKTLFYLVVALQVVFLLGMIGMKQSTTVFGQKILLKPVPVDPTDPFRGDYVTIRYEISTIPESLLPEEIGSGDTIYVSLRDNGDYWVLDSVSETDKGGVRVKGVVDRVRDGKASVDYSFDSYFVPKRQGYREELSEFDKLLVEVAIRGGDAVVTNILYDGEPIEFYDEWGADW